MTAFIGFGSIPFDPFLNLGLIKKYSWIISDEQQLGSIGELAHEVIRDMLDAFPCDREDISEEVLHLAERLQKGLLVIGDRGMTKLPKICRIPDV